MQLSEVIKRRLGWCPNTMNMKTSSFSPSLPEQETPGIPADSGAVPSSPGTPLYRHTQYGTIQIWATLAAVGVIVLSILFIGGLWITYIIGIFLLVALGLFGSLTVTVTNESVSLRFGFLGIVRKSYPLGYITSVTRIKTPWYYGWGIRWTPDGPLYNISGEDGVMLILTDGKKVRIGTDEPEALKAIISRTLG